MNAGAGGDGSVEDAVSAVCVFKPEGMGIFLGQRINNKNRGKTATCFWFQRTIAGAGARR